MTANLSAAVQARVRRLGENTQAALGLAAVLGREFNFEPFDQAWGRGEEATLEALDELLRRRLIEEQFGPDDRDFAFTHHKIQEVVYQNLPRHRRCYLHAQAGAALETIYITDLEARAGELAYHFEQACPQDPSLSGKAINFLLQACQQAVRQSANQEAVIYYQRGLGILQTQPETEQPMQQEVKLQIALAVPVKVIKGYASRGKAHLEPPLNLQPSEQLPENCTLPCDGPEHHNLIHGATPPWRGGLCRRDYPVSR